MKTGFEGRHQKKIIKPAERRELANFIRAERDLTIRRAGAAGNLSRLVYAYQPKPRDDGPIIEALTSLADKHPRYGFTKMFQMIGVRGTYEITRGFTGRIAP